MVGTLIIVAKAVRTLSINTNSTDAADKVYSFLKDDRKSPRATEYKNAIKTNLKI